MLHIKKSPWFWNDLEIKLQGQTWTKDKDTIISNIFSSRLFRRSYISRFFNFIHTVGSERIKNENAACFTCLSGPVRPCPLCTSSSRIMASQLTRLWRLIDDNRTRKVWFITPSCIQCWISIVRCSLRAGVKLPLVYHCGIHIACGSMIERSRCVRIIIHETFVRFQNAMIEGKISHVSAMRMKLKWIISSPEKMVKGS